ncbi:PREDICTED: uncharacterized protein C10orf105 homolog [Thamnophis sirtalis]|uniref:Uncharacterized protein C10orf105 homolog n=1 Tax=Thamnophis sirtalis TaxID=35019 RepID=A0A6I9XXB6_9SAUR|nr:PREDICTED: uncharacterized protein C10orf105 homolog [Thamnophis sirtalis]XP_013909140.1 PREDICTED: uncharacterized protein C10orf105 homolog [Thamnophis sirtalis]
MSAKESVNETLPSTGVPELLNATTELALLSSEPTEQNLDSLPIIIALICIFLLLTIGLLFVTLCKPAALDPSVHRPHECMPYHFEDATEPQLKLWKRLGSLRQSICSVKRGRPVSHRHETWSRKGPINQDWSIMESTAM